MRVVQLSTYNTLGGAGRAAQRLHQGLREVGHDSRMLVKEKGSQDDAICVVAADMEEAQEKDRLFELRIIQEGYINLHRTEISNTIFSLSCQGWDVSQLPVVRRADVIQLHWVAGFQSAVTVNRLLALGKPVVWTLHDAWAFTGGCHYPAGCEGFRDACSPCPQIDDDPFQLPGTILRDKGVLLKSPHLTIAAPSRWMAECARESRVFRDCRIEVIPNSLETHVYQPVPKAEAKRRWGISPETVTILFGCQDGRERRKGFRELIEALQHCLADKAFQEMASAEKLLLLTFGASNDEMRSVKMPVMEMGQLIEDEAIATAYSSADIFVLPSLEDNLPNTVLEAMSCGTPVVAFRVGGVPDMVEDGITGILASPKDAQELGNAILFLVQEPQIRKRMALRARQAIDFGYPLHVQAQRYAELYEDLLKITGKMPPLDSGTAFWEDAAPLTAPLVTEVGPHLKSFYDRVLLHGSKELAICLEQRLKESEADRKARLDQVTTLTELLKESEADRKARLDQVITLTELLKESEADRKARLDQIMNLSRRLQELEATWPVRMMKRLQPKRF